RSTGRATALSPVAGASRLALGQTERGTGSHRVAWKSSGVTRGRSGRTTRAAPPGHGPWLRPPEGTRSGEVLRIVHGLVGASSLPPSSRWRTIARRVRASAQVIGSAPGLVPGRARSGGDGARLRTTRAGP